MSIILNINNDAYILDSESQKKFKDMIRNENTVNIWFKNSKIIHYMIKNNGSLDVDIVDLENIYENIEEEATEYLKQEIGVVKIEANNIIESDEYYKKDLDEEI
jgi:hypothetical protein